MRSIWLLLAAALAVHAQIGLPGQGPFPGGTGGPFPGGGGRGRGRTNSPPGSSRKDKNPAEIPVTTTGILRIVSGDQLVLEADDHRIITYRVTDKTKIEKDSKPADLKSFGVADHLTVDSTSDDQGYFTAVAVTFNMAGTPAERAAASRTWDLPTLNAKSPATSTKRDPDDDRPVLRRKSDSTQPAESGAKSKPDTAPDEPADVADNRPTTTVRPNDPAPEGDDPGIPKLKRGRPAPKPAESSSADSSESAISGPPPQPPTPSLAAEPAAIPIQEDPVIVKAKEAAAEFTGTLPNFFCRQVTTRYQSDHPKEGWQAQDVVTADVTYEDGVESYKNITVGNRATNKSMEELGGNWSTGEFSSILDELFAPETKTSFRRSGQDTIRSRTAYMYRFEVQRENSHWRIIAASQLYYPAYRGTIWIDRETSRVVRIEMESRNMPLLFPFDKTESAIDYDFVRLSTPRPFLLPTDAEVLTCQTGSSRCARNRIEFRNYRKFGAESDITFDDKQ